MEIEIPSGGCFVASGYNVFDHYLSNSRVRYYLNGNQLVRGFSNSYSNLPSGYHCLQAGDLVYKPEVTVYFPFMAFGLIAFAGILLYNIIIKKLWQGR